MTINVYQDFKNECDLVLFYTDGTDGKTDIRSIEQIINTFRNLSQ